MADNNVIESLTDPADPPKEPVVPAGSVVLKQEDYDQLLALKTQVEELKASKDALGGLEKAVMGVFTSQDADDVRKATEETLTRLGYDAPTIEQYLTQMDKPEQTPEQKTPKEPTMDEEAAARLAQLEQIVAQMGQQSQAASKESRLQQFQKVVDSSLDPLKSLLGQVVKAQQGRDMTDEDFATHREMVVASARRAASERLQKERARVGNQDAWDDSWISEAVKDSVSKYEQAFRAVIGDPSKLGRAAETSIGDQFEAALSGTKPVEPVVTQGGDAEAVVENFTVDALTRAAQEASTAGTNKV